MRKHILLILALMMGITLAQAKPVDVAKAQRLGLSFVQHKALFAKNNVNEVQLAYTHYAENGMAAMYVFNFNGGYVIVAADDSSSPILGYSDEGSFDYATAPDGLRFMMDELARGIATVVEQGIAPTNDIALCWDNLETMGCLGANRGQPVVGPLVTTRWDQSAPYNLYVPDNCPTGCVATAMAQLMKYWEWPVTGTGEHSYYAPLYGQQYANFGATTYDWANMIENYSGSATQEQKEAVATLMYHCGVSVDMNYEHGGSGAFSWDVPAAISNYFSYSDHSAFISKGNYDEWITLLKKNLDQSVPLYYSGHSSDGGHAFVCDGYDSDGLFHFNYGWGGTGGGWLLIDGSSFEYSGSQGVVTDFVPNYIYDAMPQAPDNLEVNIDNDISLTGHLSWTNPTQSEAGQTLTSLTKVIIKRNGLIVHEIEGVEPGQEMSYDDEVPFFDQYDYAVLAVNGASQGRTSHVEAVFGPYCQWSVIMTSSDFRGWDGGGITVQNAAGSYIDFLTTTTSAATLQRFPMALGNNNLYWTEPNSSISNLSFKVKDSQNQVVYEYNGPSSGLEAGLLRTLNNSCGNENTCEAPYNLKATVDPDNNRTVVLTWESDHTPEFGYCIYRDGLLFNMSHELTYTDENTDIGGHCYYITALCSGGETENSNEYCVSSGEGCEPPLDIYYKFTTDNKVQIYWTRTDNTAVSGYMVYRKTGIEPYRRIKITTSNYCTDQTAEPGTEYQYVVAAYYRDIDCTSAYANSLFDPDKFHVNVDWVAEPRDLQAYYSEEDTVVNLRWMPAYMATSYDIMRNGVKIAEQSDIFFADADIEMGETYCYQIVARGEDIEASTNEACVEMPAPPVLPCSAPTALTGRFVASGIIRIEWQAPEDRTPDSYTVTVTDMGSQESNDVTGITTTSYETEIPVEMAVEYSYKVKAVYPECESDYALTNGGEDHVTLTNAAVDEQNFANAKLYPNPTTGQLSVEAEGMTKVGVYDLVGQCLMQVATADGKASLDLSQLPEGIYFIKVNTANGATVRRIVKM